MNFHVFTHSENEDVSSCELCEYTTNLNKVNYTVPKGAVDYIIQQAIIHDASLTIFSSILFTKKLLCYKIRSRPPPII